MICALGSDAVVNTVASISSFVTRVKYTVENEEVVSVFCSKQEGINVNNSTVLAAES